MTHSVPNNIHIIDADYIKPNIAAIHLIEQNGKGALIDTGTNHSLDNIKESVASIGVSMGDINYIILTHIHLDHAGGAGLLMQECKNANLVCHPRGARHMVNPEKLIAGTKAVYGEEKFAQLYGDLLPIEAERVIETHDDMVLDFNGRTLRFLDTPGHALHHNCIIDEQTNSAFTGDTLGLAYPDLTHNDQPFLIPTSTPVHFDPQAMHKSIDRVMSYQPEILYLTHFGPIKPTTTLIAELHEQIDDLVMMTQAHTQNIEAAKMLHNQELENTLGNAIRDYWTTRLLNRGTDLGENDIAKYLSMDAQLDAQGLLVWANRQ